ncbi:porin [Rhodopseudomonas sp. P2A-2r]|uniref:porin n=1 Tax=Rhodopseudomonas sp. P2A-2r TaxID=2991972 RepID=UPI0022344274|nr:porin [Rhodopseudomonas sp. P2A-2r]UZE48919.1 porin [Rhodopseudomonas sp. P2A-2r]
MTTIKGLILGSAAGLLAIGGAQAADLPMKAKAVEYVKICSLYGAGFYYIPGTDTCIKIGGAIRIDTALNGNIYDAPQWQGGAPGSQAWSRDFFQTRARFNVNIDTRTATEYGVLRTYGDAKFDWTRGVSGIAGGAPVEVDYAFIQFAGFTFGKSVSMFDPQWALAKPTISSGLNAGSNNATGIPMLAYTASFGNGMSATISLEDAQPYRTAGVVNTSLAFSPTPLLTGGAYGPGNFTGNQAGGDHMPDIVGNLRLDQAWGSAFVSAAGHEVHGNYYSGFPVAGAVVDNGRPATTWGYAVSGGFELKNLPTGAGDSFKMEATYAKGAAKYVWGGTLDTAGAGRYLRASGPSAGTLAFGYVLDGVYTNGTGIDLSTSWDVSAFYEHYWNPAWRTSVFGNYTQISYGAAGNAALITALSGAGVGTTGFGSLNVTGGDMKLSTAQVGTRTAWTPVKDLTIAAEFVYSRLNTNLSGTYTNLGGVSGAAANAVYGLGGQNIYNGGVQISRSF